MCVVQGNDGHGWISSAPQGASTRLVTECKPGQAVLYLSGDEPYAISPPPSSADGADCGNYYE